MKTLLTLRHKARELYPNFPYLQREWLRAIVTVRKTKMGWHLDKVCRRKTTKRKKTLARV